MYRLIVAHAENIIIKNNLEDLKPLNFDMEMQSQIAALEGRVPKLALHSCCAVCSSSVIERLSPYFNITVLYYNPNIWPREEYELRRSEQQRLIRETHYPNPVTYADLDYNHSEFITAATGLEQEPEGGARCIKCFDLRLERTARFAVDIGAEFFCSTLTVSPHKNPILINECGELAAQKYGIKWLLSDFKKRNGYLRSTQLAQEYDIYRQNYCGCEFALAQQNERNAEK